MEGEIEGGKKVGANDGKRVSMKKERRKEDNSKRRMKVCVRR
jgi:hypothetical protein